MRISAPDGIRPAPTQRSNPIPLASRISLLVGIKVLHTVIWLFFAACILAIPFAGAWRQFRWAAILSGLVLFECAILAVNRGRCPLTDLAGRHTKARADNFDIYLPLWLARNNKAVRQVR